MNILLRNTSLCCGFKIVCLINLSPSTRWKSMPIHKLLKTIVKMVNYMGPPHNANIICEFMNDKRPRRTSKKRWISRLSLHVWYFIHSHNFSDNNKQFEHLERRIWDADESVYPELHITIWEEFTFCLDDFRTIGRTHAELRWWTKVKIIIIICYLNLYSFGFCIV